MVIPVWLNLLPDDLPASGVQRFDNRIFQLLQKKIFEMRRSLAKSQRF